MKNPKQKLKEYKDFFYPLFILGAFFLLLKLFFLPKLFEVVKLRESMERQKTEIQDLTSYLNYLQEAASYSLIIEEETVNYALPYEKNIISLMATFDGLGKIEGITLSPLNLKPGLISKEDKEEEAIGEIPFEMEATAENKEQAKKFLQEIYLTTRILEIKDLKWSVVEEEKIKLNVSLLAYYWPNKSEVKTSQEAFRGREDEASVLEKLRQTKIYEEGVLEDVPFGKEDLFSL